METVSVIVSIAAGTIAILGSIFAAWRFLGRSTASKLAARASLDHPERGNTVILSNLSATPVLIDHWEIIWKSSKLALLARCDIAHLPELEQVPLTILPHERQEFQFFEHIKAREFMDIAPPGGKLYIRIYLAGDRRPHDLLLLRDAKVLRNLPA